MAFGDIDWIALAKPWRTAVGKTEAELKVGTSPVAYVMAIAGHTLIAYILSVLMVTLEMSSVAGGLSIALPMWLAFVM